MNKKILWIIIFILFFTSCSNTNVNIKQNPIKNNNIVKKAKTNTKIETITKVYKIEKMTCVSCAYWIEYAWKNLPWVISAKVNYDTKIWTITFDKNKVNESDIIKNALPYVITEIK